MNEATKPPRISVITVVFNGEAYLEKTIESVLNQTFRDIELIVVDGGSTDHTMEIVKKYEDKIRWISEPDKGIYDAMNKGLAKATGQWLNFLNGGDIYIDSKTIQELFQNRELEKINFIYGDSINVFGNSTRYIKPNALSRESLKRSLGLCHQAVFVRRSIAPFYDLSYRYKAEYNWVIDIVYNIPQASILYLPVPVVYYALGGFSEKGSIKNLKEFVKTTRTRFGSFQVLRNTPVYTIVFLRFIKNLITRPKN